MRLVRSAAIALVIAAGCGRDRQGPGTVAEPTPTAGAHAPKAIPAVAAPVLPLAPLAPPGELILLSPEGHLQRIAVVLRGGRPTAAELAAVRADPAALSAIVDAYLAGPTFGEVVRDLWHEVLLLRVDQGRFILPALGPLAERGNEADFVREVSEEPLRLIEYVAVHDRPFGEIVTADYAIASDLAIRVWGAADAPGQAPSPPPGWRRVVWDSGQPMAGILSSGALWLRHPSNGSNYHRGQAEVIADALLCASFLDRDVPLFGDIDLADESAVKDALRTDPACVSCHQTLDPLASHLFGFTRVAAGPVKRSYERGCGPRPGLCYPLPEYRPEQAAGYRKRTGRDPNFFGLPSRDLASLGAQIADDPRFSMCVARRFYGYFMQVDLDRIPDRTAASLQAAFERSGMNARALVKAIVMSDDFRAVGARPGSAAAELVGQKTTRPEQLARLVADLTGFAWRAQKNERVGEVDLLGSDRFGYRGMAGGVEGYQVTEPSFAYNPTRMLVLQALAADAAAHVVAADLERPPAERRLLGALRGDDEAAARATIVDLYARIVGESIDPRGAEADAALALIAAGDTRARGRGWALLVAGLLQDPRVAFH